MAHDEPKGCLAAILRLFGIDIGGPNTDASTTNSQEQLPYRQRDDFLSPAELSFYRVLTVAIGDRAVVLAKINLADVFFVSQSDNRQSYRNKIDRKHVDFLLCDPKTMTPRCGIELDDKSHARRDRQDRDQFVDEVFAVAGLPILHVPAQAAYNPNELLSQIEAAVKNNPQVEVPPPAIATDAAPVCPKCNVPLVERVAKKGANAGQSFYGCPNYPKCREVVAAS